MIIVSDIIEIIEKWAPPSLAESWDNVGLLAGDPEHQVSSVILTLDVNSDIIAEAHKRNALVVSHHPIIFKPLKTLAGSMGCMEAVREAVRTNVPVYAAHTNLDRAPGGVSDALAAAIGIVPSGRLAGFEPGAVKFVTYAPKDHIDQIREAAANAGAGIIGEYRACSFSMSGTGTYIPSDGASPFRGDAGTLSQVSEERIEMIVPAPLRYAVVDAVGTVHPYDEMAYEIIPLDMPDSTFGYGVVGDLAETMDASEFIVHVKRCLDVSSVTVSGESGRSIRRVAVMGGSGGSFVRRAAQKGVDAYISGDIGYHDFLDYGGSMMIVDAGHRETELPVLDAMRKRLKQYISDSSVELIVRRGKAVNRAV